MFTLTQNEREIIELMWRENRPLSRTEIIDLLPDKSWSSSSIHILLNKLLEKEAVEVDGYIKTNKNFGRTYAATITPTEYAVMQLKGSLSTSRGRGEGLTAVFSALVEDDEIDKGTITELEKIISDRRKALDK